MDAFNREEKPGHDLVNITRRETLRILDVVRSVEFTPQILQTVRVFLQQQIDQQANSLLLLLAPPGQDGYKLYIDRAVVIPDTLSSGHRDDYSYFLLNARAENPSIAQHVLAGFASLYPVRERLVTAFDQGYSCWLTLGNRLITYPEDIANNDFSQMTMWGRRKAGAIKPLKLITLPD